MPSIRRRLPSPARAAAAFAAILGWSLLAVVAGLVVDFLVALAWCRFSFPADSFSVRYTLVAGTTERLATIGPPECWMAERDEVVVQPGSADGSPVKLGSQPPGIARGAWRRFILWLDDGFRRVPRAQLPEFVQSSGDPGRIGFGWPFRSWEAWWVRDPAPAGPNFSMGIIAGVPPRPVLGLSVGGQIMTSWGIAPRGFPICVRPGPALANAAIWAPFLAVGWVAVRRWRRRRALLKLGCCPSCGYKLAGLAAGSPCPECGKSCQA